MIQNLYISPWTKAKKLPYKSKNERVSGYFLGGNGDCKFFSSLSSGDAGVV